VKKPDDKWYVVYRNTKDPEEPWDLSDGMALYAVDGWITPRPVTRRTALARFKRMSGMTISSPREPNPRPLNREGWKLEIRHQSELDKKLIEMEIGR